MCEGVRAVKSGDKQARDLFIIETLKRIEKKTDEHSDKINDLSTKVAVTNSKIQNMEDNGLPICAIHRAEIDKEIKAVDEKYEARTSISLKKAASFILLVIASGTGINFSKDILSGIMKLFS